MGKKQVIFAFIGILISTTGCMTSGDDGVRQGPCSSDWYALVEKRIPTGDGHGHGPDQGSTEWRSVVEFKLGIRGDTAIPPVDSDQWCEYIDSRYVRHRNRTGLK